MKPHKDSGGRCLVAHYDVEGRLQDACIICEYCNGQIRPEKMNEMCPATKVLPKQPLADTVPEFAQFVANPADSNSS